MQNPSLIIKAVYVIGYTSGIVALFYVVALVRFRSSYLTAASKTRAPAEVP